MTVPSPSGQTNFVIRPPLDPALAGVEVVTQGVVLDPAAPSGPRLTGYTSDRLR